MYGKLLDLGVFVANDIGSPIKLFLEECIVGMGAIKILIDFGDRDV